jgi:hypothetical protein
MKPIIIDMENDIRLITRNVPTALQKEIADGYAFGLKENGGCFDRFMYDIDGKRVYAIALNRDANGVIQNENHDVWVISEAHEKN